MMTMTSPKSRQPYRRLHPKVFMLWLGIGSIIMMFAGLTSAYIVRKAMGDWLEFRMPPIFTISTVLILLSSVTLWMAGKAYKSQDQNKYVGLLGLTLLFGLGFTVCQILGWQKLTDYGILLNGNPSGSFLYVISGLHAAHVVGGLVIMLIVFFKAFKKKDAVQKLMEDINPNKGMGLQLLSTYWHFVDILWLYLFAFLIYV